MMRSTGKPEENRNDETKTTQRCGRPATAGQKRRNQDDAVDDAVDRQLEDRNDETNDDAVDRQLEDRNDETKTMRSTGN